MSTIQFKQKKIINIGDYISMMKKALAKRPNHLPILMQLAKSTIELEDMVSAKEYIQKALHHPETTKETYFEIAKLYFRMDELSKALAILDKILSDDLPLKISILKAQLLTHLNEFDRAKTLIAKILNEKPNHPRALLFKAIIEFKQKNYTETIELCETILLDFPKQITAIEHLTNARYQNNTLDINSGYVNYNQLVRGFQLQGLFRENFFGELNNTLMSKEEWIINPQKFTTNKGDQLSDLFTYSDEILLELKSVLEQKIVEYLSAIEPLDMPYFANSSDTLTFNIWAVRLNSGGYQAAHVHAGSWISGVLYTELPPLNSSQREGALEFGIHMNDGTYQPLHFIQPQVGTLVLFPSYYLHRTIPFDKSGQRVCIAFDVFPYQE